MESGTVAAISRRSSTLAARCGDGQFTLIRFDDSWTPAIGETVQGELRRRGPQALRVGDGSERVVEVESFNCSAGFAGERLSEPR